MAHLCIEDIFAFKEILQVVQSGRWSRVLARNSSVQHRSYATYVTSHLYLSICRPLAGMMALMASLADDVTLNLKIDFLLRRPERLAQVMRGSLSLLCYK